MVSEFPKKILLTANTSWYLFNFRFGLIKELQNRGCTIYAIAPKDEYVGSLENSGVVCFNIEINSTGLNPMSDIYLIYKYFKLLRQIRPQIILSFTIKPNIYGNIAAQILRIPVINTVSGLGTIFIKKTVSSYIGWMLYYLSFKRTDWIFFQNTTDRDQFIKERLSKSTNSSVVLGSGVNTLSFISNRNINKGKVFLFVGRLLGDKGIREFIEAAKRISKKDVTIKFVIAGELGSNNNTAISSNELDSLLSDSQIIYKGKTDNILKELKNADVMVLPSYREGLSKSLIEAAAMKLPIITTNVPGCREVVVDGKNGFLCKAKDPEDLYLKMLDMINLTETERINMGEFSRNIAENIFDEKIIISKYLEKISDLIKE